MAKPKAKVGSYYHPKRDIDTVVCVLEFLEKESLHANLSVLSLITGHVSSSFSVPVSQLDLSHEISVSELEKLKRRAIKAATQEIKDF